MDLEKMAMLSLHLPYTGKIVDMGSGTGKPTSFIAHSYPFAEVIGVDIDPQMVKNSNEKYTNKNLSYEQGDISKQIFPSHSLDAIINSSVIHHVTSFSGTGYDILEGIKTLFKHSKQLKEGGILILRDFILPEGPLNARLRLRNNNGENHFNLDSKNLKLSEEDMKKLSTFQVFKIFAKNFRSSIHKNPISYKIIQEENGWSTVELDYRTIVEFMFHKDYLANWNSEIKEEYLYMSQNQFEEIYKINQLRILVARAIYNDWIYENRFKNQVEIQNTKGEPINYPPTKILIVGEKVKEDKGVKIYQKRNLQQKPQYLKIQFMQHQKTKQIFQIIKHPLSVIDVIPYFKNNDKLYIVSRKGHPRGIINAQLETPHLRNMHSGGYVNEPMVTTVKKHQKEMEALEKLLVKKHKLIKEIDPHKIYKESFYYPSEGLIAEKVSPYFVDIESEYNIKNNLTYTEAGHTLRAFQVGGSFDSRLEINIYRLLKKHKLSFEEWIGNKITVDEVPFPKSLRMFSFQNKKVSKNLWKPTNQKIDYAENNIGEFSEINSREFTIDSYNLEYALPKKVSHHTLSFIPIFKSNGKIYVGLEIRDLPVPQIFENDSIIPNIPAFRAPKGKNTMNLAKEYSMNQLEKIFKIKIKNVTSLGLDYRVSMGITPEITYPFVAEVTSLKNNKLQWISLQELYENESNVKSAHLLTSLFRLYHALNN